MGLPAIQKLSEQRGGARQHAAAAAGAVCPLVRARRRAAAARCQLRANSRPPAALTPSLLLPAAYSGDGEKDKTGFNACEFGGLSGRW